MSKEDGVAGWLVVTGTVNEGFTFYGSFDSAKDADEWAQHNFNRSEYNLAVMNIAAKN